MGKEVRSFSIIILLFCILTAWWALSATRQIFEPEYVVMRVPQSTLPTASPRLTTTEAPLIMYHTFKKNIDTYTGMVAVRSCESFRTNLSTFSTDPVRLRVQVTTTHSTISCTTKDTPSLTPFSVAYGAPKPGAHTVLDSIKINNTAAAFTVIEK